MTSEDPGIARQRAKVAAAERALEEALAALSQRNPHRPGSFLHLRFAEDRRDHAIDAERAARRETKILEEMEKQL